MVRWLDRVRGVCGQSDHQQALREKSIDTIDPEAVSVHTHNADLYIREIALKAADPDVALHCSNDSPRTVQKAALDRLMTEGSDFNCTSVASELVQAGNHWLLSVALASSKQLRAEVLMRLAGDNCSTVSARVLLTALADRGRQAPFHDRWRVFTLVEAPEEICHCRQAGMLV